MITNEFSENKVTSKYMDMYIFDFNFVLPEKLYM